MNNPTSAYKQLKKSIRRCSKIANRVPLNDIRSESDELKIRSLILLTHSTLEEYLEELSRETAEEAVNNLKFNNQMSAVLLALVTYHRPSLAERFVASRIDFAFKEALLFSADECFEKHKKLINENHGIKKGHQNKLMFPVGVNIRDASPEIPSLLEAFAEKRGSVAHRIGIRKSFTRSDIQAEVSRIVSELRELDRICCGKSRETIVDSL